MKINYPTKKLRKATEKQIEYGSSLGLNLKNKSFRVTSAMIADEIEKRCWKAVEDQGFKKGDRVKYIGNYPGRKNKVFTVTSVGKYGQVYFFIKNDFGNKKLSYANAFNLKKIK